MFVTICLGTIRERPARFFLTCLGVGVAFFLASSQVGLLVGWIDTNTALIRHAGADLWLMARQTPAWDYGTAIPRQRVYQARSTPGVEWAEGLFVWWNIWRCPNGKQINVEIVGLDHHLAGGPWTMKDGTLENLRKPEVVIVDELYLDTLGVGKIGDEIELYNARAVIGGICRGVRTFTASPHVFMAINEAIRYDRRFSYDDVTYALVHCVSGADVAVVQAEMRRNIPQVEVLTTREFAARSARFWMLGTGIGITVVITAVLGLAVGAVITSQTLFATTQENLPHYATLLALGFRRRTLSAVVLGQSLAVGMAGAALGSALFFPASWASARTPIPLETTPLVYAALVAVSLLTCLLASFISVRTIFNLDPVVVFRQ